MKRTVAIALLASSTLTALAIAPAASAAPSATLPQARLQVMLTLLSATGTVDTQVSGSWNSPYHWADNGEEVNQTVNATFGDTAHWQAPKQNLSAAVFGQGGLCSPSTGSCQIQIGKVTGSIATTGTATYADGTVQDCTNSLSSLPREFFQDSARNAMFIHFKGVSPGGSVVWVQGGSPTTGVPSGCEVTGGMSFPTEPATMKLPYTAFTKAKIGKPFTVTVTTSAPVMGASNETPVQIGTLKETTTLKLVVTRRYSV